MPIYEYHCKKCGKTIEILQSNSIPRQRCGGECVAEGKPGDGELQRVFSAPSLPKASYQGDKVDYQKAAKKGLMTYKRSEKGVYEKIAGNTGPQVLKSDGSQ